jgi:hypothetical protein
VARIRPHKLQQIHVDGVPMGGRRDDGSKRISTVRTRR